MSDDCCSVLFIAYYYPPAGGAALPGSQRTVKFVRNLDNCDCHVLSLGESSYREYIDLNFQESLPVKDEKIYRTRDLDLFKFLLYLRKKFRRATNSIKENLSEKTPPETFTSSPIDSAKRSLFQKFKDFIYNSIYFPDDAAAWFFPAVWNGYQLVRKDRIDVIFATGMPWTSLVVAYVVHLLTGVPLVVDFRDPWVGNPYHVSKGKTFDFLMHALEKRIVHSAAYLSANTPSLRDDFVRRYPSLNPAQVVVLPNGFDLCDFDQALQHNAKPGPLRLAHAGSLYGRRSPKPLLNALISLAEKRSFDGNDCSFVQMGYIEDCFGSQNYDELLSSGLVKDKGLLPYDDCLVELATADVAVLIQPATKIQIPSKLYDYLAMNKHILAITPLDGALAELMLEKNLGDVFAPEDCEGIACRLFELTQQKKSEGSIAATYGEVSEFDVRHITKNLEKILIASAQQ